jgi:hypothetical protein
MPDAISSSNIEAARSTRRELFLAKPLSKSDGRSVDFFLAVDPFFSPSRFLAAVAFFVLVFCDLARCFRAEVAVRFVAALVFLGIFQTSNTSSNCLV